jgi:predicted  nucleic acid-binding Zn-ribbon protein
MSEIHWRDVTALLAAATLIGGMVIAWVRYQLRNDFARASDISGLSERIERVEIQMRNAATHEDLREIGESVARVEAQMRGVPSHQDVRALAERVTRVEGAVEVVSAKIEAVREGVGRVEHDMRLLTQHLMRSGG